MLPLFLIYSVLFSIEEPTTLEKSVVTKYENLETKLEITQLAEKKSKLGEDIKKLNKEVEL